MRAIRTCMPTSRIARRTSLTRRGRSESPRRSSAVFSGCSNRPVSIWPSGSRRLIPRLWQMRRKGARGGIRPGRQTQVDRLGVPKLPRVHRNLHRSFSRLLIPHNLHPRLFHQVIVSDKCLRRSSIRTDIGRWKNSLRMGDGNRLIQVQ